MAKWILTHDSHEMRKGDTYEGESLPSWLAGKVFLVEEKSFEVATPQEKPPKKKKAE